MACAQPAYIRRISGNSRAEIKSARRQFSSSSILFRSGDANLPELELEEKK